jgi:hypothetical protein
LLLLLLLLLLLHLLLLFIIHIVIFAAGYGFHFPRKYIGRIAAIVVLQVQLVLLLLLLLLLLILKNTKGFLAIQKPAHEVVKHESSHLRLKFAVIFALERLPTYVNVPSAGMQGVAAAAAAAAAAASAEAVSLHLHASSACMVYHAAREVNEKNVKAISAKALRATF